MCCSILRITVLLRKNNLNNYGQLLEEAFNPLYTIKRVQNAVAA
jgi:hypothetical protein